MYKFRTLTERYDAEGGALPNEHRGTPVADSYEPRVSMNSQSF